MWDQHDLHNGVTIIAHNQAVDRVALPGSPRQKCQDNEALVPTTNAPLGSAGSNGIIPLL